MYEPNGATTAPGTLAPVAIVLVITTDPDVAAFHALTLADEGYTTITAVGGAIAEDLLATSSFDAVYIDGLPHLANTARRAKPDARIVVRVTWTADPVPPHPSVDVFVPHAAGPRIVSAAIRA